MGLGGLGKEPGGRSKGISDRKTHSLSQLTRAISNWTHNDHNAHSSAMDSETGTTLRRVQRKACVHPSPLFLPSARDTLGPHQRKIPSRFRTECDWPLTFPISYVKRFRSQFWVENVCPPISATFGGCFAGETVCRIGYIAKV